MQLGFIYHLNYRLAPIVLWSSRTSPTLLAASTSYLLRITLKKQNASSLSLSSTQQAAHEGKALHPHEIQSISSTLKHELRPVSVICHRKLIPMPPQFSLRRFKMVYGRYRVSHRHTQQLQQLLQQSPQLRYIVSYCPKVISYYVLNKTNHICLNDEGDTFLNIC